MTLKNIPVDASQLGRLMCVMVAPKTDLDGVQRVDRDGSATWTVSVAVAPEEGRAALIEVAVPGEPQGLMPGMPVDFVGLVGFHWEMAGRSGISFRADKVAPSLAPPVAAAAKSAGGAK